MIFQFRLFGLIFELLWVWGVLVGFTFDKGIFALNAGFLCVVVYQDQGRTVCAQCLRPLKWGLHGTLGRLKLCRR